MSTHPTHSTDERNKEMKLRTRISGAALATALAIFSHSLLAADPPSELDLRAAYCLKLTEASIKLMSDAPKPPTKMLESLRDQVMKKQQEKRDQLAKYVESKPTLLAADATREALKTVDSDAKLDATGRKAVLDACATGCKTTNPPANQEGRTCIDACAAKDDVVKRLDRCTTLEWLGVAAKK